VIVAPSGTRGRVLNRQGYARLPAGLDHRRYSPIHWAADTPGDKSEGIPPKPGRPQRTFSNSELTRVSAEPQTEPGQIGFVPQFLASHHAYALASFRTADLHSVHDNWVRSVTSLPGLLPASVSAPGSGLALEGIGQTGGKPPVFQTTATETNAVRVCGRRFPAGLLPSQHLARETI
jgi:hypothetical protein